MHIFLNISFFFSFSSLHGHMKGGEAYLKGVKKKGVPMGVPGKRKERKWKGERMGVWGGGGVYQA